MSPRPSLTTIANWQNRRFGMFIHWGLYSIPAGVWDGKQITGYSEQIQAHARIPKEEYVKLAEQFDPLAWDPHAVVELARQAGMKFIVLTSKHHDGFSLFDTQASDFNVVKATPYGRDIVKGLAEACSRGGLEFGVYYSTIDWHFEGGTGIDYGDRPGVRNDNEIPEAHAALNVQQLNELMTGYGPISEVWFDMGSPTPAQSEMFAEAVHSNQPEAMVSGRVFNYQGDFTVMGDNEIPPYRIDEPWQCPASIFHETWGYRSWQERKDVAAKTREHITNFVRVVSRGGNYLLNIGPRGDGSLVEFEVEVLRGIGKWLEVNHLAIEGTLPQPFRHLSFGAATTIENRLYAFVIDWPEFGSISFPGLKSKIVKARWLGGGTVTVSGQNLTLGDPPSNGMVPVIEVILDGEPVMEVPGIKANSEGEFVLNPSDADRHYHFNGRGYYDAPKLYKLSWRVDDLPEEVEVFVEGEGGMDRPAVLTFANQEIRINSLGQPFPMHGREAGELTLRVADGMPKGVGFGFQPTRLVIRPRVPNA